MTVMEWIAAAAAIAFIVLAAGLLLGVRSALRRLSGLERSAAEATRRLGDASAQLKSLLEPAEQTVRTAQRQLQSADRLFRAAARFGDSLEETAAAVHRITAVLSETAASHAEKAAVRRQAAEAMEWAELGMAAWQLWNTNRKRQSESES